MRPLPGLAPLLAPLGPAGQGSHLQREHHEGHADHDGHQQLGRPDLGRHVSVAHGGEGDDAEVEGRQQGQVAARALQVLDAAGPGTGDGGGGRASAGLAPGARPGLPATARQLSPTRRPSLGPGPALRFPTLACRAGTPSAYPRAFLSCPEAPFRPLENWTGARTQRCVGSAWAWGQRRWTGPPRLRAPTCHPPRNSSSPRRSDGAGHAQPPRPARAGQSFPRHGPVARPHIHHGAAHSGAGALPRVDALAAGRGQAGPPRRFLPRGHPAPLRWSVRLRVSGGMGEGRWEAHGLGTCPCPRPGHRHVRGGVLSTPAPRLLPDLILGWTSSRGSPPSPQPVPSSTTSLWAPEELDSAALA